MDKVTAYKAGNGAPLETDPTRAFAWKLEAMSEKRVSFSNALWILQNSDKIKAIIDEYKNEEEFGAKNDN